MLLTQVARFPSGSTRSSCLCLCLLSPSPCFPPSHACSSTQSSHVCTQDINRAGAAKMQRHLTLLRDALSRIGGQRPDEASSRAHERARIYFDLLKHPTDILLASLEQSRQTFSAAELAALLQVSDGLCLYSQYCCCRCVAECPQLSVDVTLTAEMSLLAQTPIRIHPEWARLTSLL